MQTTPQPADTELSDHDREAIVRNLDACVALLDKYAGRRTLSDIKIRSMVAVLRDEMATAARMEVILPPLGFHSYKERSVSIPSL